MMASPQRPGSPLCPDGQEDQRRLRAPSPQALQRHGRHRQPVQHGSERRRRGPQRGVGPETVAALTILTLLLLTGLLEDLPEATPAGVVIAAVVEGRSRGGLAVLIDHDDADRELAYQGTAATFDDPQPITTVADRLGWVTISMRDDWTTIFPT